MRTKKFTSRFHALVITLAMVISQLIATVPAMADNALLPIAQHVTKTGSVQCGADGNSAIYNGHVKMNVPMTEVMKSHETDMANAASNGWYPHGREGRNKIAYIEYNVTFPENVNIGNIAVTNKSSFINGNKIVKTVNGRTVNFKFYLNDVNWQGIYNAYNADKANPNAHTVNVDIPYSFTVNSKADAVKFEGENITGKGDFSFYPSGTGATFGFGLRTYNSDVAQLKFAENLQNCFTTAQNPTPQDFERDGDLEGDILIGNETEHDKVFESNKGATHDFTGALNVKPIKEQMKQIEHMFNDPNGEKIKLSGMDTTFTASIELPEGMTFGTTTPKARLDGANGKFEITETKLEGRKVTVTLKLKDAAKFKTYKELADTINAVDDTLKVTVPGAKFTTAAQPDTNYTVKGTVGGNFKAAATQVDSGKTINFKFKWNGKQTADGADAIAPNDLSKITFTLKYKNPTPQDFERDGDLEGDILIGNETEHDKVFESNKGATHDFTGALNVKPIKEQMKQIEHMFNDPNGEKIKLSGMDTTFTASIELPEGMTFGTTTPKARLDGANGKFEITETKLEGRKVTVTLKLKDAAKFKTYKELADTINAVDDTLKVTVPGAKFTTAAQPDTNYTVKGTVGGNFKAAATQVDSGKTINFKFKWNGKQTADGADAIAPNDLSKITFTLKYKKSNNPVNPINPVNPTNPDKTIKVVKPVKTGDNTNLLFYLLLAGGSIAGIAGANTYRRRDYK